MQKIVDWMAGVERTFDGKAMGFMNRKNSALKFLGFSVAMFAAGLLVGMSA